MHVLVAHTTDVISEPVFALASLGPHQTFGDKIFKFRSDKYIHLCICGAYQVNNLIKLD